MATATPTRTPTPTRAARISQMWDDDDRLVNATHDLFNGLSNASSELVGHLIEIDDPRESETEWIHATIETVEFAGVSAARAAMIEKLAELLDEAPASLVDHPDSKVLRGLRGLRRE